MKYSINYSPNHFVLSSNSARVVHNLSRLYGYNTFNNSHPNVYYNLKSARYLKYKFTEHGLIVYKVKIYNRYE